MLPRTKRLARILPLAMLAAALALLNKNNELTAPSLYLIQYKRLALEIMGGLPYSVTYPLFGYPLLVAAVGLLVSPQRVDYAVLLIQLVLSCALVVAFIWRHLSRWSSPRAWLWTFLLVPVFSFACLRGPDAWVMSVMISELLCLRNWARSGRIRWLATSFAGAVIGANMRSEALGFFTLLLAVTLFVYFSIRNEAAKSLLVFSFTLICGAAVGAVPWVVYTSQLTGRPLLTSTNSGMTAYEGLAQLPGNPWGWEDDDAAPGSYVQSLGISDSTSVQGNDALLAETLRSARAHPDAFLKKVSYISIRALTGGVYTLEDDWSRNLTGTTKSQRIKAALDGERDGVAWALGSLLEWVFRIVFFGASVSTIWLGARSLSSSDLHLDTRLIALFCAAYLIFSIAVVALVRYQARYVTATYPLLVLGLTELIVEEPLESLIGHKRSTWVKAQWAKVRRDSPLHAMGDHS